MNELIKGLYDQADKFASQNRVQNTDAPGNNYFEIFHKKFAELIVAETISVLQKRFMGDLNREDMEVRKCIEDVKNHFAVKE